MYKLLEKLHTELQQYGPEDTFNKDFYLTLTKRLIKDMEADGNKYVMLPAYLGQIVYDAEAYVNYKKEVYSAVNEGRVSMLQQKTDGSWKIRVSWYKRIQGSQHYNISHSSDYTVKDFNTQLHATKEAAETEREELVNKRIMELKASENNTKEN